MGTPSHVDEKLQKSFISFHIFSPLQVHTSGSPADCFMLSGLIFGARVSDLLALKQRLTFNGIFSHISPECQLQHTVDRLINIYVIRH